MELIPALQDVVEHFLIFPEVKIISIGPYDLDSSIYAFYQKNGFGIVGRMNEAIAGINERIGFSNMSLLRKMLSSPGFMTVSAKASLKQSERDSSPFLMFENHEGHSYKYVCMDTDAINREMPNRGVRIRSDNWIKFFPNKDAIAVLKYWNKAMMDEDERNSVEFLTKGNRIFCRFRSAYGDVVEFPFSNKVDGKFEIVRRYQANMLIRILDLYGHSKSFKIHLGEEGQIWMDVESELARYRYVVGALWEDWLEYASPGYVPSDMSEAIKGGFGRNMDSRAYMEKVLGITE